MTKTDIKPTTKLLAPSPPKKGNIRSTSPPSAAPAPQALVPPRFLPGLGQLPRRQHLLPNSLVMRQRWDISEPLTTQIRSKSLNRDVDQKVSIYHIQFDVVSDYVILWRNIIYYSIGVCLYTCASRISTAQHGTNMYQPHWFDVEFTH